MSSTKFSATSFHDRSIAKFFILKVVLMTMFVACGTETGNPVIKRPSTPRNVAHDTVEAELMELSELGLETGSDSDQLSLKPREATPLSLAQNDLSLELMEVSECTSTITGANFTFQKSFERSREFRRSGGSLKVSVERKQQIVWDSPLGAISCKSASEVQRRPRFMEGTSETKSGSFKKIIQSSGRTGKSLYSNAEFSSSGNRKTVFSKVDVSTTTLVTEKTITWNVSKTNRLNTSEGESTDESSSVVSAENPIKMVIERNRVPSLSVKSKSIKSGRTVTTRANGSQVEIEFLNLTFGANDDCYPSSGKIIGKITSTLDSTSSPESFEIDFSSFTEDVPEIIFVDGEKIPLNGVCFD